MGRARKLLTLLLCSLIGTALGASASVAGAQTTRQLQQADPFSQFLDTTPAAGAPGAPAPSDAPAVNTNGVPAAANSATTVPVLGSPYTSYPQQQTVAAQQAAYQQQLAAQQQAAYQQQLAAQQQAYGAQQPAAAYPGTVAAAQPGATAQPVAPAVDRTQPVYAPAPAAAALPTPTAAAVPTPAAAAALTPAAAPAPAAEAPAPAAAPEAPTLPATPAPAPKAQPVHAVKPAAKPAKAPEPVAPSPPPASPPSPPPSPPPTPPPSPPPPNPPPPYPPGMIQRSELTNQIPANATALRTTKILLPEGAAKNFSFAWVCDAKGGLYLSVNKENMISCGKGTIDLSQMLKIKGAKPITCPDTGKACPGNTAVTILSKFANTAEQFKAQQSTYINGVAKAASVSPMQVVVTNVKLLYKPKSTPPPAEPAAEGPVPAALTAAPPAEKKTAANKTAKPTNGTIAKPKSGSAKPESALVPRLSRFLRRLLAEAPKKGSDKPAAPAADKKVSLDAEAVVEELPGGPKPLIEVTTSIQPLTQSEADSVLGTTSSPYFISTYKDTLAKANLTSTEDIAVKIAEPAKEYIWPEPVLPKNATIAATNTTRGIIPIPEAQEPTFNASVVNSTDITPANDTTNATKPATSSAGRRSLNVVATAAAVVLAAVLAL